MTPAIDASPHHQRLIRKLESICDLGPTEVRALAALPMYLKDVAENADLVSQGEAPVESCLVVEGFVCRYQLLKGGGRQIFSFHLPGDIPDLQSLHLHVMDHSITALTPTRVAMIPHAALQDLIRDHPVVAAAFWRDTLVESAVYRAWLAGIGRRTARARIAHLLCEVYLRARSLGLTRGRRFDLPITQPELGDSLGLSAVHVNRVLQELRREELITSEGRYINILDWHGLKRAGEFDASYLHIMRDPAD